MPPEFRTCPNIASITNECTIYDTIPHTQHEFRVIKGRASQKQHHKQHMNNSDLRNHVDDTVPTSHSLPKTTSDSKISISSVYYLNESQHSMLPPQELEAVPESVVQNTKAVNSGEERNNDSTDRSRTPLDIEADDHFLKEDFLNGGYWASWKQYDGVVPSHVRLKSITHINYAFADIDGDGTVYLADENVHYEAEIDGANGALRAWTQRRRNEQSFKVILAVGGGSPDTARVYADVASNRKKCSIFIQSLMNLVELFELDGIDVDWEYPTGPVEGKHYIQLLASMRQAMGWHRWVTVALPAGRWGLEYLDLLRISELVDFINLMAYDFVGPDYANVDRTGHHAQLYQDTLLANTINCTSGDAAVCYLIERGVPSRKIMLGVPLYGRVFKGAEAPHQPFEGPGSGNDATYEVKDLPRPGMTEFFDENVAAAFAAGNNEFITYDNRASVAKKAAYVKEKNLRGLFYWHLAGDRSGDASLIEGGYAVLSAHSLVEDNRRT